MNQRYNNFIRKSILKHGKYYDYSFVNYINAKTKVRIICPEHGEFEQIPDNHTRSHGCPNCGGSKKLTNDEFIIKAKEKHKNKYDYSLVEYMNNLTKINIICPKHGEFKQRPSDHLNYGCNKCGVELASDKNSLTNDEFIIKAKEKHGDYYDYSSVIYISHKEKVEIICPKHGEFIQKVNGHLNGQGCPICKESKGERRIRLFLKNNNINFIRQHKFNDCRNIRPLPFDFYLTEFNLCIEYDGEQHYRNTLYTHTNQKLHDDIKNSYCTNKNNRPKLIRIPYTKFKKIEEILSFIIS
jgi:hypothetical protein